MTRLEANELVVKLTREAASLAHSKLSIRTYTLGTANEAVVVDVEPIAPRRSVREWLCGRTNIVGVKA